jgi:alpha-ketoglutarate-dependent taurine dioxygenase
MIVEAINKNLNLLKWIEENKAIIDDNLLIHGGILLRNFNISSISEFNRVAQIVCPNLLDYVYRSTPRTKLGGKIYTATEYPADRSISLHNENAYSKSWPKKIMFFSAIVATHGGETPIADSRKIYQKIDPSIKEKFEKNGVLYVRNYNLGVDLSWQEVFQTESRAIAEQYCKENDIEMQWKEKGTLELTTQQRCQATISHPITNEKVWFNQAHLFHISALDKNTHLSLVNELGAGNLPRNALYGDGQPIENEVLDHIRQIYNEEKILFKWQKNDLLILDNLLMAHGREPYQGERKVAVAMA